MKFKKIILYVTLFLLLYPSITVANTNETPNINSRAAIVLDRATKKILYGKTKTKYEKWHLQQKL